jgi:hypothetical protein
MLSRGRRDDDRQLEGLGRFRERHDIVLQLAGRVVAHAGHQADLMIDEHESGIFSGERRVAARGHVILRQDGIGGSGQNLVAGRSA